MHRVLIVGAGGFGRELLAYLSEDPRRDQDWELGGFLDENAHALDGFDCPFQVVGSPEDYSPREGERLLIAIGNPRARAHVVESLAGRSARFTGYVHPTAKVGSRCSLGEGVILCPGALLTCDVRIGDHVHMNVYSTCGHDVVIGSGSTLSGHCDVTGNASLGERVFLGTHATVLPGVRLGNEATLGAGSVAMRDVPEGATVVGVPGRVIHGFKKNSSEPG